MFYRRIENSTANGTALINYTVVMDSSFFTGGVLQVILSLVGHPRTESYFRLSNGTISRTYSSSEIETDGHFRIIRESIVVLDNPVPVDTFHFELGAAIIGITASGITATTRSSRGVVEVINSQFEQPITSPQPQTTSGECRASPNICLV